MFNQKDYQKQYYLAHREKLLEKNRAWAKNNPDKHKAIAQVYYNRHRKTIIERQVMRGKLYGVYKSVWRNGKVIPEHRAVMQEYLGRELVKGEVVHHKDGNKRNNVIANLELLSTKEHELRHREQRMKNHNGGKGIARF